MGKKKKRRGTIDRRKEKEGREEGREGKAREGISYETRILTDFCMLSPAPIPPPLRLPSFTLSRGQVLNQLLGNSGNKQALSFE